MQARYLYCLTLTHDLRKIRTNTLCGNKLVSCLIITLYSRIVVLKEQCDQMRIPHFNWCQKCHERIYPA